MQSKNIHPPSSFALQSASRDAKEHQALHVAIIMDGNGRWAEQRGLPRVAGHRAGGEAARRTIEHALDLGVECLTLFAFSSDNWRRPAFEVQSIFWLLRAHLRLERERLRQQGARLEVIGRRDRLPKLLLREIESVEAATSAGRRMHVRVAVDYSSREAITRAALALPLRLAEDGLSTRNHFERLLNAERHSGTRDVDLLIRTGGEKRLSDFLLWESAYAELLFLDCMWPDFTAADLEAALHVFKNRERRFGGVAGSVAQLPAMSVAGT